MKPVNWNRLISSVILSLYLCIAFGCHHKLEEVKVAGYIMKEHLTSNSDSADISNVLDTLLFNTPWRGKKQINRPYNEEMINIYIIDGSLSYIREDNLVGQLVSNCAYAGSNIIFLDNAYLRNFLDQHHVFRYPKSAVLNEDQECLLYWVIGHELGHLMQGHLAGHFESGSLDSYVNNSSLDNRDELQADSFFVHTINANKTLRSSVEHLVMNILNAEIEQEIGKVQTQGVGLIYDYTNTHVVQYAQQPTHPEYVIRLSRMLELSSELSGDTGLHNLIGGFIKQLKEVK